MAPLLRLLLGLVLLEASSNVLLALDGDSSFTLDLPYGANAATPIWLGHPVEAAGPFATLKLPITPPDPDSALLITVFFQEQTGGFLRISWQSDTVVPPTDAAVLPGPGETAVSSILADNFYEGIGMGNQRSLLIPASAMVQPGSLCFQTGSTTLGITRIHMEWLTSSAGLSSSVINELLVTPADGQTRLANELAGQPALTQDPTWQGTIVNVPVTDVPLRIEQGLDFTVQIESVPTMARIALKEDGLPWGQHLVVWVNNQRAGMIIPGTPSLGDGGYSTTSTDTYLGWRDGSLFVPTSVLLAGANTIQFAAESDVISTTPHDPNAAPLPLAVKEVVLQLAYPGVTSTSAATAAAVTTNTATTSPSAPSSANGAATTTNP